MPISYTFCATVDEVANSLQTLSKTELLIVDCEGRDLGTRDGALSTISVGTEQYSDIFVYDAVELDRVALLPVLELLSNPKIIKVFWDGRMDFSEIFHSYRKRVENVLDMQIVEIMSRESRGETELNRQARIKTLLRPSRVFPWREEYEDIIIVVGMKNCLGEQGLAFGDGKDRAYCLSVVSHIRNGLNQIGSRRAARVTRIHEQNLTELWMRRPLATDLLNYAAKDVHLIRLIYEKFKRRGYLNHTRELLAQSQRYVSMHDDLILKPLKQDRYRGSSVLPLDILERPTSTFRKECDRCHRKLSGRCFMQQGGKYNKVCKVCHVVAIKYRWPIQERYE
jgi:exonuclease 3'-5' domain-containing protein 1